MTLGSVQSYEKGGVKGCIAVSLIANALLGVLLSSHWQCCQWSIWLWLFLLVHFAVRIVRA